MQVIHSSIEINLYECDFGELQGLVEHPIDVRKLIHEVGFLKLSYYALMRFGDGLMHDLIGYWNLWNGLFIMSSQQVPFYHRSVSLTMLLVQGIQ